LLLIAVALAAYGVWQSFYAIGAAGIA